MVSGGGAPLQVDLASADTYEVKNRPGERHRVELRSHWRNTLRKSRLQIVAALAVGSIAAGIFQVLPMPEWENGYLLGLLTASLLGVIAWFTHMTAGHHNLHYGMMGEECTGERVLTLRRRIQGWRLINGLYFAGLGDVDHVLIGPGGVFAIESKWTNVPWKVEPEGIIGPDKSPTKQARLGARKVVSALRSVPNPMEFTVTPVVVLWGPGAPEIDGGFSMVDDVLVVEGRSGRAWIRQLSGDRLPRTTSRTASRKLEKALKERDDERIAMMFAPALGAASSSVTTRTCIGSDSQEI
ncbi:MAG: nuclease-related domain-containing protein [Acidimicrobiales bacterium]